MSGKGVITRKEEFMKIFGTWNDQLAFENKNLFLTNKKNNKEKAMKTKRIVITVVFTLTTLFALHTVSFAQDDFAADVVADEDAMSSIEDEISTDEALGDDAADVEDENAGNARKIAAEKICFAMKTLFVLYHTSLAQDKEAAPVMNGLFLELMGLIYKNTATVQLAPKRKPLPTPKPFPCCM